MGSGGGKIEATADFQRFESMLALPAFWDWSDEQFGLEFGKSHATMSNWRKRADWESIRSARQRNFAYPLAEVDLAMFKAAAKGNVPAATLIYQRFDGYVPTQRTEALHQIDEAALDDELKNLMDARLATAQALGQTTADLRDRLAAKAGLPDVPKTHEAGELDAR